jgi:hypothetical protein
MEAAAIQRERESSGAAAGKKKKNSNKGLTIGVGYSGRTALRRRQCDVYA